MAAEVATAMRPWLLETPANPSSSHRHGQRARAATETARAQVAALVGEHAEVIFTSGGTEADNQAVWGLLGWPPAGHLVVSVVEHPAILEPVEALRSLGVETTLVPVDERGCVDPADVVAALRADTRLVSLMAANNEVGTLQPVAAVTAAAHERGIPVHCDAVQAAAWFDLPKALGDVDLVTLAAHKIGGPPGIGALALRDGRNLQPLVRGGGQQRGRRGGTEPTPLIVGFGAACARASARRAMECERIEALTHRLEELLQGRVSGLRRTVPRGGCLPNTLHLLVDDCPGDRLVARLDLDGVAASAGSACASGVRHSSHVLAAMGIPPATQAGALRLSLGYGTSEQDVDRAAAIVAGAVTAVRDAMSATSRHGVES